MASGSTGRGSNGGGSKGGRKSAASKRFSSKSSGTKYTYDRKKAGGNTKYDDSTPWGGEQKCPAEQKTS